MEAQSADFYTKRYILSTCMEPIDITALVHTDGNKINSWKKSQQGKIFINHTNWQIELDLPKENYRWDKSDVTSVKIKETKDTDASGKPKSYILIVFKKDETLSISGPRSELFFCGLKYHLEQQKSIAKHPLVLERKAKFEEMLSKAKEFLTTTKIGEEPAIPPPPPNLNFVTEIAANPA